MSYENSMDSDRMEHKMDSSLGGGAYHSAYEIYEEKVNECQNVVKNLKDKIDLKRDPHFHYMRKYFGDNNYYNSLPRGSEITRVESHSNSRSDADHSNTNTNNESLNNSTTTNINTSNNAITTTTTTVVHQYSGKNGSEIEQRMKHAIPSSRQAAEEKLKRELSMKIKIRLQGHGNKVYAIDWHKNNRELISAARDAKCMIWDAETGYRKTAFNLDTEFTMDCKFSPNCSIVACGGLDDTCSIYVLTEDMTGFVDIQPKVKLQEHGGIVLF